jgi:hypothetical protein
MMLGDYFLTPWTRHVGTDVSLSHILKDTKDVLRVVSMVNHPVAEWDHKIY